jgi:hypothetical protein
MAQVFCLLNCFNNYDICASKIIEFYITNGVKALNPLATLSPQGSLVGLKTFFDSTPYMGFQMTVGVFGNGAIPTAQGYIPMASGNRSVQLTNFIWILALTAVTLARIANSNLVVFANQGVVAYPGFATMFAIANQLNKKTVLWTDDLRNQWGTTNDPLVIGMTPLPYKYLWSASEDPNQNDGLAGTDNPYKFSTQPKGANGYGFVPQLGKAANYCPTVDQKKFENNWNTFVDIIRRAENEVYDDPKVGGSQNAGTLNKRVEGGKNAVSPGLGVGWVPSTTATTGNTTLYWDLEYMIVSNSDLLYNSEQEFLKINHCDTAGSSTHLCGLPTQPSTTPITPITPEQEMREDTVSSREFAASTLRNRIPFTTGLANQAINATALGLGMQAVLSKSS